MHPEKPDWYWRVTYHAINITMLILLIAGLVKLIRSELGL